MNAGESSPDEKLLQDLNDCMHCRFFWGNDSRCISNKCCKETKKEKVPESECTDCPYRNQCMGFPCWKKLMKRR